MKRLDKQFFDDKGYVVVGDILTEDEVCYYKALCYSEVFQSHLTSDLSGFNFHLLEILAMEEKLTALAKHPKIIELIKPILGENIQLQHSKLATKMPGEGKGEVVWHQDFAFFPHTNTSLVAVMIALDDITKDNGCMQMVAGSYKKGPLNHNNDNGKIESCQVPAWEERNAMIDDVIVPRGGVSIHHCLNVHGSQDNLSDYPRTAVVFEYRADDAMQLADGVWKDTGMMISGVRQYQVRCESLVVNLPRSDRYGAAYPFGQAWRQVGSLAYLK